MLWLLVGVQVAVPGSYYLLRDNRDDERFAWRMFSAVRLKQCSVQAFDQSVDGSMEAIDLSRALHASWTRLLGRGRRQVMLRFLASRCALSGARASVLERRCQWPSQRPLEPERYRYDCDVRKLESD